LLWYMFEFARSFPWFAVNEPRLRKFNAESVTECFDQLTTSQSSSRPLHFVFIGDSRMRQQFYSFLEVSLVLTLLFASITVDCTVFTRSRHRENRHFVQILLGAACLQRKEPSFERQSNLLLEPRYYHRTHGSV
jgi:hypothetical protein